MELVNSNSCRKTEVSDWIIYLSAHLGGKVLQNMSEAEEQKPYDQREPQKLFWLEVGKLVCIGAKLIVNSNLCTPITID